MSYSAVDSIKRLVKNDLLIIVMIIMSILTVQYAWALLAGVLDLDLNTPSVSSFTRAKLDDTDGDNLPDLIEGTAENPCTRGEVLPFPEGYQRGAGERDYLGVCTGTDPNDPDSDNDGFTDGIEDNLGSDPNLWISPGFVYLFWLAMIIGFAYNNYSSRPSLDEYEKFDEVSKSGGVAGKDEGKFAYSTGGIMKKYDTKEGQEEARRRIEQDPRVQRMIAEGQQTEPVKKGPSFFNRMKRKWPQILISVVIGIIAWYLIFRA